MLSAAVADRLIDLNPVTERADVKAVLVLLEDVLGRIQAEGDVGEEAG